MPEVLDCFLLNLADSLLGELAFATNRFQRHASLAVQSESTLENLRFPLREGNQHGIDVIAEGVLDENLLRVAAVFVLDKVFESGETILRTIGGLKGEQLPGDIEQFCHTIAVAVEPLCYPICF